MLDESSKRERADKVVSHADEPMTSTSGKGTYRESNIFLMNKHPELFEVSPRPGGFLRHLAARRNPSHSTVDRSSSKPKTSTSITTNVSSADRANIDDILETSIRCPSALRPASKEDKKNNTVRMCSIAITTVMMLAQHIYENITSEHVKHTEEYFRELRQADGYPHNVGQLVQLLKNLKKNGKIVSSSVEKREDTNEEKYEEENSATDYNSVI